MIPNVVNFLFKIKDKKVKAGPIDAVQQRVVSCNLFLLVSNYIKLLKKKKVKKKFTNLLVQLYLYIPIA